MWLKAKPGYGPYTRLRVCDRCGEVIDGMITSIFVCPLCGFEPSATTPYFTYKVGRQVWDNTTFFGRKINLRYEFKEDSTSQQPD